MAFVRKSAGRSGATKVQIAERKDGRNHILEHVGTARSEAELAVLVAEARRRLWPGQEALDLGLEDASAGSRSGVITGKRSALLWQVLTHAYARLGFEVVEDAAFAQLVLARVVEPTSKADSLRVLDDVGIAHASLRTMFRTLKRAGQGGYRDQVAAACFAHASTAGDISLCLYDVTTLSFEAEKEDALRKVGYSKERRVDPQVVVGLLVDRRGFPLEIGCFEGNKAETLTLLPMIEAFQARHGIADMVLVADAGMLSAGNLTELDKAGLRFIVGSRVTKAPQDLESHFRWYGDAFTDGQVIDTIASRVATKEARAVNDTARRAEPAWDPEQHDLSWRGVGLLPQTGRPGPGDADVAGEPGQAVVAGEKAARTPRIVTVINGARSLDEASLARARRLVGLKGYVTNIPATLMPAGEVIAAYHELWLVEASFRMAKSDLRARPVFHHTREAIEAHLTIVVAALAVARYLQDTTGLSIKKIVRALRPLQQITVRIAGHDHVAADPLTDTARDILTDLGLEAQ